MKSIFTLLFLLVASTLLAAEPDRVAILLREPTLKALAEPLRLYMADVEQRFPVKLHAVARDWKNPAEVRAAIKSLHDQSGISGVILIGAMPMHRFFMHEHPNPNPLYYEDFDLRFVDKNKDGVDEAYEGKPHLKLWVANIRATEKANHDDLPALRRFFAKTHDDLIYQRLRAGDYLGKAYLPCKQAHEIEHAMGDHTPGDIVSGILMIGNPFLRLKPVKREANRHLVIKNAVYGDLANNVVVNVTQKVTDWLEDALPVHATADNFGTHADGIEKQLKVEYTLDGVDGMMLIDEGQLLKIEQ